MRNAEQFDVLILGSGQGGKLLAWSLAREGNKVAVVERRWIGGSCPAVACLPSKNESWGARIAHLAKIAGAFGTNTGEVSVDMPTVKRRKQRMIEREIAFHRGAYKESGAELVMGLGRFVGPKTIEVLLNDGGTRALQGKQVVVNVGTHAAVPDVPGLVAAQPMTHTEALELDYVPAHLFVIGAGYVGVEMAQAFRRFGSRVTILEPGTRIMSREDPDVSDEMARILRNEGIEIRPGAELTGVQGRSGKEVKVNVRTALGEETIEASDLLVSTGRIPNSTDIGLGSAGIETDARGYVRVDDRLQTTAPNVWAIGECAGSPHFTHVSVDDFRIVKANMAGHTRSTANRLVPHIVFTDPPLAHVGLNETEAQRRSIPVRVARLPVSRVLRTEATDETQGFMKVLVSHDHDGILGFTMIGSDAGEVMAAMQTAILAKLPYQHLQDAVIAHLTMAEGIGPLLAGISPRM
jgi:pyruvate/2-oxoglutarate dehydrogenase complex dihydrolipoamide dehydrogenase (E3) component